LPQSDQAAEENMNKTWSTIPTSAAILIAVLLAAATARVSAQVTSAPAPAHKSVYGRLERVDTQRRALVMKSDDGERLVWQFAAAVIAEAAKVKPGERVIVIYRQLSPSEKRVTAVAFPGAVSTPTYVNMTGSRVALRSGPAVNGACGAPPADPGSLHESTIMAEGQAEAQDACWCCASAGESCVPANKSGLGRALLVACF
jgi:hypothetical protein